VQSTDYHRVRNWAVFGTLGLLIGAGVISYPFALVAATQRFGVSEVAGALLIFSAISFALPGRLRIEALRRGAAPSLGIPALLLAAAISKDTLYLELVPSAVYLTLASCCFSSIRSGVSMIEHAARFLVPEAPSFINAYCSKVTGLWGIFFTASALGIAVLALAGDPSRWTFFTGKLIYTLMLAVTAVEFLVRKTWFRYYFHDGWFDRFWSWLFPAENTPEGRRSMQYIAQYRRERGIV
jgi:uncharacterized membrane protein